MHSSFQRHRQGTFYSTVVKAGATRRCCGDCFRDAVAGFETIKPDDFQQALNLRNVAITKLSQALFLVNPSEFLPFNNQTNSLGFFDTKSRGITLEKYASCIDKVQEGVPRM